MENPTDDALDNGSEASSPTLSKNSLSTTTGDLDQIERLEKDNVDNAEDNSDSAVSSEEEGGSSSDEDTHDIRKGPVAPRGRSKVKTLSPGDSPARSPARSPAPPGGWSGKRGPGPLPPGNNRVGGALSLFNELQEEGMCDSQAYLH